MAAVEDSLQTLEVAAQGAWLVEDAPTGGDSRNTR